jgi:hypothetical protein
MSRPNWNPRQFKTKFRRTIVVRPEIKTAKEMSGTVHDYVDVPAIATRGTWPVVHMIRDDTLIRLGVASGALPRKALAMLDGAK